MADFPALEPEERSYLPAEPLVNIAPVRSGTEYRVRRGRALFGQRLQLRFVNRSAAEALMVIDHYVEQGGGQFGFDLPTIVTQGYGREPLRSSIAQWYYAEPPGIEPGPGDLQTVTVTLEAWA
jgi:hypothetical protein